MNMDHAQPPDDGQTTHPQPASKAGLASESQTGTGDEIARQLTGELFCIHCGYNLHGLSIRSNCSECGVPVRATILGIVDPKADELMPLYAPRLTAIGLNAWSIGAMLAIMMVWVMRAADVMRDSLSINWTPQLAPWFGIGCLIASMLGSMTMIRSHPRVGRIEAVRSAASVSLYAPLIFVYSELYLGNASASALSVLDRSILRLAMFVLIAGIIYGLRPQAVGLAIRSVVVRTGRVDRQSLLAVLAALGIAAVGDLILILGSFVTLGIDDVLSIVSIVVISLGSVLFTVGMINICFDTIRLFPILVRPGVGLSDIFETNRQKAARTGEK